MEEALSIHKGHPISIGGKFRMRNLPPMLHWLMGLRV